MIIYTPRGSRDTLPTLIDDIKEVITYKAIYSETITKIVVIVGDDVHRHIDKGAILEFNDDTIVVGFIRVL